MRSGFEVFLIGMAFLIGLIFAVWGGYEWHLGRTNRTPPKPTTKPPYRRR